ncbi:Ig-like domain-containing protein [Microcystis sp. M53602_WE12]|uniref:Ig-like domain-containing protein n=1 Tax=Microcystis sp. M53602_WE12 TaxID=3030674 RepID=UPI0025863EA9|nr:Ig-like domain-containing protein [Microcystis sp. M53602_WE12]MDJ0603712.1 Ig-like domain-containing protein [Microcystis sp. M53602_WE12]
MIKTLQLQPIDKLAITLIVSLTLVIGGLIWLGNSCGNQCLLQTGPRVKEFSWENREIGSEDQAFIITFDRPMDHASVEKNLVIDPPLPGKLSWAGRRLAYTLTSPIPYGEKYHLQIEGAREQFRSGNRLGQTLAIFEREFKSRNRAFAYIGTNGEEQGRLIFYNLTEEKKTLLTPANLTVMAFEFYPDGKKILFSAVAKNRGIEGIRELQLYQVDSSQSPAKIELVLDNKDYQNNHFDLAKDGETIVVQRIERRNPINFDLWAVKSGEKPQKLNIQGGEFLIAPDSKTLAVTQGEGIALLPLKFETKPLDFLPKFGRILNFSADGTAAAMVNFNTDNAKMRYIRSLFYVNNQGLQKRLLNLQGSIIDCQFNATGSDLYCLLTELVTNSQEYKEKPYFAKIDVKTGQVTPLLELADYRDIHISLSPDGLAIIFDQLRTSYDTNPTNPLTTDSGETIIGGRLWMLIPPLQDGVKASKSDLIELPLAGIRPQWMP